MILKMMILVWNFGRNQVYYGVMSSIELGRLPVPKRKELFKIIDPAKQPRAGTTGRRILEYTRQGFTRWEIAEREGITAKEASGALKTLWRIGCINKPTPEESVEAFRRNRSNLLFAIKPYVEMGMSVREISIALEMKGARNVTRKQISDCVGHGRYVGFFPKLLPQESTYNRAAAGSSKNKVGEKVRKLLAVRGWFLENGFDEETMPKGRAIWERIMKADTAEKGLLYYQARKSAEGYSFADFETFASAVLPKKDLSETDKLFLETYYCARIRRAYDANAGDFEGLGVRQIQKLKDFHTESDKDIFERLNPYIKLIQANTATVVEIRIGMKVFEVTP